MKDADENESTALQAFEPMDEIYSIETVVSITQVPRHQIAVYCRHGLIAPVSTPEREGWWFDHDAIRMLRRIEHLRIDYDVKLAGLRVISELLREVERLRDELRSVRRA